MSCTFGQIKDAGREMNKDSALSDALLQKLYKMTVNPEGIPLADRQCHEKLREHSRRVIEEALADAADKISIAIGNACYCNWERF